MIMSADNSVLNAFNLSDEVMNRLFIQKPFIFGEIRFLINNFESRLESDDKRLNECSDQLKDIKDNRIDSAVDLCHSLDEKVNSSTDRLTDLMTQILDLESQQVIKRNDVLKTKREQRNQQMIESIDISKNKIQEIDAQFERQENDLRLYYKDLETKLKIIPNSSDN